MPVLTSDGIQLHYEVAGQGPAVLFLHGYTATVALWKNQVSILAPSHSVVCLDQRGHGESQGSAQSDYTLANLAGDAIALLDHLGLQTAVIVGHSMGGMVGFELLANHGDRVRAAVFSSTTPIAPERKYFEPTVEFARTLGEIPLEVRKADPMMQSSEPLDEATAFGCGEMIMSMSGYLEALTGNETPCLIVHGSDDSDSIVKGSEKLRGVLNIADHAVIDGAGHVPQITHPDQYNAILNTFLSSIS